MLPKLIILAALFTAAFSFDCMKTDNIKADPETCCPLIGDFLANKTQLMCHNKDVKSQCDMLNCIIKQEGLMANDNTLIKEKIMEIIRKGKSPDWIEPLNKVLAKCYDEMEKHSCPIKAFGACVVLNGYKSCPSSVLKNTAECTEAKTFIDNCSDELFKKFVGP